MNPSHRPWRRPVLFFGALAAAVGVAGLGHLANAGATAGAPGAPGGQNQLPTSVEDFFQPGTQPEANEELFEPVLAAQANCVFCHAEYLEDQDSYDEPWDGWTNGMMAQAVRDPVWQAAVVIANQDAVDAGEYCIRCHAPGAWLGERSMPSDGSAFIEDFVINDFEGVQCHFCHRSVNPLLESDSPPEDVDILNALEFPPGAGRGNGRYVVDPDDVRRGPYQDIAENPDMNPHGVPVIHSPFHRRSDMCATCHDLGNPVFERQEDGTYTVTDFDTPHPTQDPYDMFPEQRTYSEWLNSQFANGGVLFADGRFGGNHPTGVMEECQDCHMPDQIAGGCSLWENEPWFERQDLPQHSWAGANRWVLTAILSLYPDGEAGLSTESVASANARAADMLRAASDAQVAQVGDVVRVRLINYSGHKLPTGYPEGRRMWLNIQYFDELDTLVAERGAYDYDTAELDRDGTKVYECVLGMSAGVAETVNLTPGPTQHLVLADEIHFDNRIPPMGFTNAAFDEFGGAPVGQAYADGQYWDDTQDAIPAGAVRVVVTLYHQIMSREYIEFLRDTNVTNDLGQEAYRLWSDPLIGNKDAPLDLDMVEIELTTPVRGDVTGDGVVDFVDILAVLSAWGPCPPPDLCVVDLNGDGVVDFEEILVILSNWG